MDLQYWQALGYRQHLLQITQIADSPNRSTILQSVNYHNRTSAYICIFKMLKRNDLEEFRKNRMRGRIECLTRRRLGGATRTDLLLLSGSAHVVNGCQSKGTWSKRVYRWDWWWSIIYVSLYTAMKNEILADIRIKDRIPVLINQVFLMVFSMRQPLSVYSKKTTKPNNLILTSYKNLIRKS